MIALPPLTVGTTRLILLRHGEPDETLRARCYGRLDAGLSAVGREQMRRTWRLLSREPVAAVYTSPSRRAIDSAGLRAADSPAPRVDQRLCEIDFGEFEGLTYREIASKYPDTYIFWMTRPAEVTFPGGESLARMAARVRSALDGIRRTHAGETVVVVSHGGVNRIALAAALDLDPRHMFRLAQAYACVNAIDYIGDEAIVRLMNATVGPC